MTVKRAKIVMFLLVVGLIAALAPVCGCNSQKKTTTTTTGSTCPTTAPQTSAPQSQSTTPPTSMGTSKSEAALAQAKAEEAGAAQVRIRQVHPVHPDRREHKQGKARVRRKGR